MTDTINVILAILSHPAWQGMGVIITLIALIPTIQNWLHSWRSQRSGSNSTFSIGASHTGEPSQSSPIITTVPKKVPVPPAKRGFVQRYVDGLQGLGRSVLGWTLYMIASLLIVSFFIPINTLQITTPPEQQDSFGLIIMFGFSPFIGVFALILSMAYGYRYSWRIGALVGFGGLALGWCLFIVGIMVADRDPSTALWIWTISCILAWVSIAGATWRFLQKRM